MITAQNPSKYKELQAEHQGSLGKLSQFLLIMNLSPYNRRVVAM